ncbi:MAG: PIN domain-containing protein, partial [Pseudomonadota bacterium]
MKIFVDTNVLVSARDPKAGSKQTIAAKWLAKLDRAGAGALAAQSLREYYSVITRPRFGISRAEAREDITDLLAWVSDPARSDDLAGAWAIQDRYKLSFIDCLLLAAAQASACEVFLSEDMHHG